MLNSSKKLLALYFLVHVDDFEIKRAGLRILKRERLDLFLKRSFFHYQPLATMITTDKATGGKLLYTALFLEVNNNYALTKSSCMKSR